MPARVRFIDKLLATHLPSRADNCREALTSMKPFDF